MSPLYFPGNRTKITRKRISNFIETTDNGKKIMFSYRTNAVAIMIDYSKEDIQDLWNKGVIYCRGQRRYKEKIDIEQAGVEDKLLYHSSTNGMEIHLFVAEVSNEYSYCGVFVIVDVPYQERYEDDAGSEWFEWIFPMVSVRGGVIKIPEKYKIADKPVTVMKTVSVQDEHIKREKIRAVTKEIAKNNNEEHCDYKLLQDISNVEEWNITSTFKYNDKPKLKTEPKIVDGYKVYVRNKQTAINALTHAGYECEISSTHPTFIRKNSDKKYTEPHHLIPLAFSELFEVSLDIEQNIVSLCSNCHNQIHYGRDAKEIIVKLYEDRKELLASVGIVVTLEQLLEMYGIYYD